MVNEAMVRQIVGTEGANVLVGIVRGAWQDYLDEGRARFHRSTRANVVWDHMVLRSEAALVGMDGVQRVERQERPMYVLRDRVVIRPKLHTRESRTRNYPTKAQEDLEETGLYEGLDYQNLTFGYQLDRAEADVESCVITSPTDPWIINLEELAAGELRPVSGMLDMPDLDRSWRGVQPIRRID